MKVNRQFALMLSVSLWGLLTIALAAWWTYFGLNQLEMMESLFPDTDVIRKQRMWLWEGTSLIGLIVMGIIGLFSLVIREKKRTQLMRQFYATLAHDVKTSLSSIRLKAESLSEKLTGHEQQLAKRLTQDSVKLELQMENALVLASETDSEMHFESVNLSEIIKSLAFQWPQLSLVLQESDDDNASAVSVLVDYRALRGILSNLFHNAYAHGRATEVIVRPQRHGDNIHIDVIDNGIGQKQPVDITGSHKRSGTSGLGLFLARKMALKMGGNLSVKESKSGFRVSLVLRVAP